MSIGARPSHRARQSALRYSTGTGGGFAGGGGGWPRWVPLSLPQKDTKWN